MADRNCRLEKRVREGGLLFPYDNQFCRMPSSQIAALIMEGHVERVDFLRSCAVESFQGLRV